MRSTFHYRLGIDVGANSLGWCVLEIDDSGAPVRIVDLGARILTATDEAGREPKSGASLAVERRTARGMRRRRDRYLLRKDDLMQALVRHGLMPADVAARKALEKLDPYAIRAQALHERVPLHHLGRAFFHLHQRRGFKSNRKSDIADAEAGLISQGIEALKAKMDAEGACTIGEFLARRHAQKQTVRARITWSGKDAYFPFYLDRALIEDEFNTLWARQARHHPALTDAARDEIHTILFRQRPLRPVKPGKCALYPEDDERAPRALPLAQRFRILKELADLKLRDGTGPARPLTIAERDILLARLLNASKLDFDQIRRTLKLDETVRFSLESERRKDLKGDETAARLSTKKALGKAGRALSPDIQTEVIEALVAEQDGKALERRLSAVLDPGQAAVVARLPPPEGHSRYGRRALAELVGVMESKVDPGTGEILDHPIQEYRAVAMLGHHHSDHRPSILLDRLPYYGEVLTDSVSGTGDPADRPEIRFGRLANPTVHIALNQLRRLVNALIDRFGPPAEVVIEMARELKLSRDRKREIKQEQAKNEKANDARRARLAELGQPDTGLNRLLLRLYDELPAEDKCCVYSGQGISCRQLFSSVIEVDHVLPFSTTLDDSFANKVLCYRASNRGKRDRSPADWLKNDLDLLATTLDRASRLLPANKSWRFAEDAMERFEDLDEPLPRRLVDTQYIARMTRRYLGHVCPDNKVWATNGRLTAMLRGKWGLNALLPDHNYSDVQHEKNRRDHRHHAIDAFVIAVTHRGLINEIARAAHRAEQQELGRIIADMPDPFSSFREQLTAGLDRMVVSHRPDHGVQGKLHEATAYGPVTEAERAEGWTAVYRKPAEQLSKKELGQIRNLDLRRDVQAASASKGEGAVYELFRQRGIHRVRILKKEEEAGLVAVRHGANGQHRKTYAAGSNHHIDIIAGPDGNWRGEGVSMFQANQTDYRPAWMDQPGIRLIMRLHKGDLVEVEHQGLRQIMRVCRLQPSKDRLILASHEQGGALQKRHDDEDDPFRWWFATYSNLQEGHAKPARVDVLGRVSIGKTPR